MTIKRSLLRAGKVDFVVSVAERDEFVGEREEQAQRRTRYVA